jgi:hypothetical protein
MRVTVLLAGVWLVAAPVWPQGDTGIEIHGVVREIGLGLGLTGAEVTIFEFAGPARQKTAVATALTDPAGEFIFHPARLGDYWIAVKKQAYFASIPIEGVASLGSINAKPPAEETGTLVTVSAAHPSQEVRLALMRPGELSGTVLDDSDKPIRNTLIEITMAGPPAAGRAAVSTDSAGVFRAPMLMPGDYIIKATPRGTSFGRALPKFSQDDLTKIDQELEAAYWPDVPDQVSAASVRVSPGASLSLGTIHLHKTPSYRVRVSIEGCASGDAPSLTIIAPGERALPVLQDDSVAGRPFARVESCEDALVLGLKPGSYTFQLDGRRTWASTAVEVVNKNREARLTLSSGVDVSGRIILNKAAGDGVTLPALDKVSVEIGPGARAAPDAKGAFRASNVMGPSQRIHLDGLSDKYCVKEIRVDGQAALDGVAMLYQGSVLEIVLDDQPASVLGSVTDGDKPFSQPLVFVAKWPSPAGVSPHSITGDNRGQFQITGLEPGEYRVLAVPSTPLPDGQQIKETMLGKLWADAERVTLERGGSKTVALKLTDPLR